MRVFARSYLRTNQMKIGPPYTPLPLEGNALFFPSTLGGGDWGGVSVDPTRGLLFVNVMHVGQWGHMEKRGSGFVRTSAYGPYARFWNRETRIPCQNPPFGELVAVDLASGDIAWRSALGRIEALEAIGVRDTGSLNLGGSIATAGGLVFIGARNDSRFRAFDSKTRKAALGNEAGSERAREPNDLHGTRRTAIRGGDGGGRRSVSGRRNQQHTGRLCAAGCPSQAFAGFGVEAVAGAARGKQARQPASGNSAPAVLPPGRRESTHGENMRNGMSFSRGRDGPENERKRLERDRTNHGGPRSEGFGSGGEGDRRLPGEDVRTEGEMIG